MVQFGSPEAAREFGNRMHKQLVIGRGSTYRICCVTASHRNLQGNYPRESGFWWHKTVSRGRPVNAANSAKLVMNYLGEAIWWDKDTEFDKALVAHNEGTLTGEDDVVARAVEPNLRSAWVAPLTERTAPW